MKKLETFELKVKDQVYLPFSLMNKAQKLVNLHYLGEEDSSQFNEETNRYEPKYPDKETNEFKDAHYNLNRAVLPFFLHVDLMEDGTLVPTEISRK